MPRPTADDPNLCSGTIKDLVEDKGWLVCERCGRVLKQSGAHRVRSRTTQSLDNTRDSLLASGIGPLGNGHFGQHPTTEAT
jgi:hypothetical protein